MTARRPLLLYLMVLAFALLALANALQWIQALQSAAWLKAFGYMPSPIAAVFEGFFFMLLFLACLVTLWLRAPFAPLLGEVSLAVLLGWSWIDRLWGAINPRPISDQWFALGVSVFLFLLAQFSLFLLEPFMRRNEKTPQKEAQNDRTAS